ncbi:hypothetical protein BS50DRAFT_526489, partial [Corynespora cassiicola Philippines]
MASEPRKFPCNTCSIIFTTSELQRSHMRQPWHIYNLRRRVAELPALSEEEYEKQATSREVPYQPRDSEESRRKSPLHSAQVELDPNSEDTPDIQIQDSEEIPPTQCLFCDQGSPTVEANIEHMSSAHGLFIPSPEQLSDLESFLGYLATIIFDYNECLYCGQEKGTVDGVQTHMRDKGHCMIKMSADSELLDFWELSDSEGEGQSEEEERAKSLAIKLSETEMRLPSGVVINSRSDTTQLRARPGLTQSRAKSSQQRIKRDERRAIAAAENPETPDETQSKPSRGHDRRVAVRGELGLVGVPESQIRALQITEKKMKRREAVAKAAYRHAMEQQPVKTIYYKTENPVYQAG